MNSAFDLTGSSRRLDNKGPGPFAETMERRGAVRACLVQTPSRSPRNDSSPIATLLRGGGSIFVIPWTSIDAGMVIFLLVMLFGVWYESRRDDD